jgi:hypothetical protein
MWYNKQISLLQGFLEREINLFISLRGYSIKATLPSRRDLCRDLKTTFDKSQKGIKTNLQDHIKAGGRVSLTMDTWTARNKKEYT